MIKRKLEKKILQLSEIFPVIALTGPRQSGKTTLVRSIFGDSKEYVNLENIDVRNFAKSDPRAFLDQYKNGVILDEAQNVPELFSYIQQIVDDNKNPCQFILTGSQNFLLLEKITQSLAGRVAIFNLLPLSIEELKNEKYILPSYEEIVYKGMYPSLYIHKKLASRDWYLNYIQTYVERDLRMIKKIHDLGTFQIFLKLLAARTGQLLDLTSIGNDCGISHNTVKEWINILEMCFIVYRLKPHYKNFNKRLIKSSKIYFYDTGLLCYLLDIKSENQFATHYLKGNIFESFIISEIIKNQINQNQEKNIYFWRDKIGHEIDCLLDKSNDLQPIEIKSSKTINLSFFDNIKYYCKLSGVELKKAMLIYGGEEGQKRSLGHVLSWKMIDKIS